MIQSRLDEIGIEIYDQNSKPYGLTYGAWTVKWWQWALLTPLSVSPISDTVGQRWKINQPPSDVWFLAGKFGSSDRKFPKRVVTMPVGRSVLFPILNCEANPLEYPELETKEQLVGHVAGDVDTVVMKSCIINGINVTLKRVSSDPTVFPLTIDKDNAFNIKNGGTTYAVSDGFWVFLKPLREGNYTIDLEGSCEFGRLSSGAKYELKVEGSDALPPLVNKTHRINGIIIS